MPWQRRMRVVILPPHHSQLRGLGVTVEQPELRTDPWEIGRGGGATFDDRIGTAATVVGLIGGVAALAASLFRR